MTYFEGLTKAQFNLLSRIACGDDSRVRRASVKPLVDKELVQPYTQVLPSRMGHLEIQRYEVPLRVHIAWAQWCAANVTDEEMAEEDKNLE